VQTVPLEGPEFQFDPSYKMDLENQLDLKHMLECCGRRDRALLEKSLEGYSAEEIAQTEGITPTGIRVRLLRIRQNLREQLAIAA
jgi:DNA-directed RNA polymerase specialized sigma24 family protein